MNLSQRTKAFVQLGLFLKQFNTPTSSPENTPINAKFYNSFLNLISTAKHSNGWFTPEYVNNAVQNLAILLQQESLEQWLAQYQLVLDNKQHSKRVGVIMAGNIPMVGFHDMLCVLLSGNIFVGKTSSEDKYLMPALAELLIFIEPEFQNYILFTDSLLKNIDAIIATGSNNSARYFEYYFAKYPHIIRSNRNSIALLDGSETKEDLQLLGKDIFQYFGLGCRNVSKIFVPIGYNFDAFFDAIFGFQDVINNNKYANNYDYNKTVYLMGNTKLLDNGFLLLKEDSGFSSPIATLFYEYYSTPEVLKKTIQAHSHHIQCLVSNIQEYEGALAFGKTQQPALADYADGINTMQFLLHSSSPY